MEMKIPMYVTLELAFIERNNEGGRATEAVNLRKSGSVDVFVIPPCVRFSSSVE